MAVAHFRAGVVAVVRRGDGAVLAFERADPIGQWQLPQGGIEDDESPREAVWRELFEETGLGADQVRLVAEHPEWLAYEWPRTAWRDRRRGSVQRWFLFDVLDESVIPTPDGREFVNWRWSTVADLVLGIVEFKRESYRRVLGG